MHFKKISLLLFLFLFFTVNTLPAAYNSPSWSREHMAATPHIEATKAAIEVMENGGNAVDAIVAASFVLAVVEPYHSGIGGGEFTLIGMHDDDDVYALDARESAPQASTADMYLDSETGEIIPDISWRGGLAAGVPGSVAGRIELIDKYGNLSLKEVMLPAYRLAKNGFIIDAYLARQIKRKSNVFAENKATAEVFLDDFQPLERGDKLIQEKLAETLKNIWQDQGKSFYHGEMADFIAKSCQEAGGVITAEDLGEYKTVWRKPVEVDYRDYQIYSMPPPSSGGICIGEILNILEGFDLSFFPQGSAESIHLIASAFEYAFADRIRWLGDSDFNVIPRNELTSKTYAEKIRKKIQREFREPVEKAGNPWELDEDSNTSHLSVIDQWGNMCSMTTSVNTAFGSMVFVDDLGFFLNSTMNDFNIAPDELNRFKLAGGEPNLIEPNKRPLSSMSPTLVYRENAPYMCIGSVGGPRIITSVAQIIINVVDYDMNIQAAIDAPRVHMQWKPDRLYLEPEISHDTVTRLRSWGWREISNSQHWSLSQGILLGRGNYYGATDARGVGWAGPEDDRNYSD